MSAEVAANPPPLPPPLPPSAAGAAQSVPPAVPAAVRGPNACANCGQVLSGPFCSNCGQHVRDFHRSVWRFVADFFDNAFCWDNKLFLTLQPLLTRPGALTLDYLSGHRVRYVHPFRLFLFTSAVCLTLMQYFSSGPVSASFSEDSPNKKSRHRHALNFHFDGAGDKHAVTPKTPPADPSLPTAGAVSTALADPSALIPGPSVPGATAAEKPSASSHGDRDAEEGDSGQRIVDEVNRAVAEKIKATAGKAAPGVSSSAADDDPEDRQIERWINDKVAAAGGSKGVQEKIRKINEDVQRRLSWVALAMLPIFAMMLRALYWRRDSYYFAHFVFSLHYHTFLLLFGAAYVLLQWLLPTSFGWVHGLLRVGLFLPGVYLWLALRRMYGERIRRTLLKVFVLGTMHLCALVIGLSLVGALASYKEFKDVGAAPAPATPAAPATPPASTPLP